MAPPPPEVDHVTKQSGEEEAVGGGVGPQPRSALLRLAERV